MEKKTSHIKIFLVDDQAITNLISKKLIEVSGLSDCVYDFICPKKALNAISEYHPDLILLDLNMPEIDGWEFIKRLNTITHKSKIVIVTSSTSIMDKQMAKKEKNVIDFYSKPLNLKSMKEIFNKLALD
ncbi:response regulator [Lacinutrix mariniflava]|uniref:response regulator n=1 Tax=Lacinutrix mariniflava TaxID=342955 RepID=UPI0006E42322|nr:response regulator [Lacinutrix mariniflava]